MLAHRLHCGKSLFLLWWTTNVTQKRERKNERTNERKKESTEKEDTITRLHGFCTSWASKRMYVNCTVNAEFVNKIIHIPAIPSFPYCASILRQLPIKQSVEVLCHCIYDACSTLRGIFTQSASHLFLLKVDRLKACQCYIWVWACVSTTLIYKFEKTHENWSCNVLQKYSYTYVC